MNDSLKRRTLMLMVGLLGLLTALVVTPLSAQTPETTQGEQTVIQAPALPGAQPISARDRVYTSDQVSNTVTVINPATNEVLGTIPLGNARLDMLFGATYYQEINTHGLGFSPDGRLLNVINVTTNSALVIDPTSNTIQQTFYVGRAPHEGFISPNGQELWVAVRGQDYVSVIDLKKGREIKRIQTALSPSMVIFSPNGHLAFVDHARTAELDVIDVQSHKVIKQIKNLVSPFSPNLAISPDGKEVWLTHKDVGKVTVVDAEKFEVLTVLDTGPTTNHVNFVSKLEANFAYVTVGGLDKTLVYRRNGANPEQVAEIAHLGKEPHGLWPSPDNTRLYVVFENSDSMDVIDTDTNQIITTLSIGQQPQTVVYVANAVPTGEGRNNLSQQGLNKRIVNQAAEVEGEGGMAQATIRELETLDMIEISAEEFPANAAFTVFLANDTMTVPVVNFQTDAQGKAGALAFTVFFDTFNRVVIAPKSP